MNNFEYHYAIEVVIVSGVRFIFVAESIYKDIVFRIGKVLKIRHPHANILEEL